MAKKYNRSRCSSLIRGNWCFPDKMKPATTAKLCHQASDLYAEAMKQLQLDSIRMLWPKDWIPSAASKQAAFHALAEYFQSRQHATDKEFGEQIARLKVTVKIFLNRRIRELVLDISVESFFHEPFFCLSALLLVKMKGYEIKAVFLCCCSDCQTCPANAIQMGQATWKVWAAVKKYDLSGHVL